MINEKIKFLTVSWLSGLLSAEIFISTGEWGVQMPPLGVISLTFRELSKIISRKYTMPVITFYGENFKLKLRTCAQSIALGTRTKFQLEMLIGSAISATHKFRGNILESSRNVSETIPWPLKTAIFCGQGLRRLPW